MAKEKGQRPTESTALYDPNTSQHFFRQHTGVVSYGVGVMSGCTTLFLLALLFLAGKYALEGGPETTKLERIGLGCAIFIAMLTVGVGTGVCTHRVLKNKDLEVAADSQHPNV